MEIQDIRTNDEGAVIPGTFVKVAKTLSRRTDFCFSSKQKLEKKRIEGGIFEVESIDFDPKKKKYAIALKTGEINGITWVELKNLTPAKAKLKTPRNRRQSTRGV